MGSMTIKELIEMAHYDNGWLKRHLHFPCGTVWAHMGYDARVLAPEGGWHRAGSTPTVIVVGEHV